jgi:hypothetical protein
MGSKLTFTIDTVGKKSVLVVVKIFDPRKVTKTFSSQKITANKPFKSRPISFSKIGIYKLAISVGTKKLYVNVKALPKKK